MFVTRGVTLHEFLFEDAKIDLNVVYLNQFSSLVQVLQKQMDLELELFGDVKDKSSTSENKPGENKPLNASAGVAIGKVFMLSLSSQPVDHEDVSGRSKVCNCRLCD